MDTENFISALHKPASLLPIAEYRQSLLYAIETFPVNIVVGQTGSGKTTQIPQFLEQAGWCSDGKVIAVTQPRRLAAVTVANRVAEEMGCKLGAEVGYSIRFEDVTSAATRIKFLTDGLLLREALVDPLLSRYSVIIADEAHERSLSTDLLLGVLKKIMKQRPELRVVISSATVEAEKMLNFFAISNTTESRKISSHGPAIDQVGTIMSLEGRAFPVDIHYTEVPVEDYVQKAIQLVWEIHTKEPDGDILVFLTGREEIDSATQAISELSGKLHPRAQALQPLALYAGLPTEQQVYVFEPGPENTRKVIFATNIAETSVTIDGIVYVVDSCFVKVRAFNADTGIDLLTVAPVSQASAVQRAGRAGRTKPGKCYRLCTAETYKALPWASVPEIQRSNLAPVILQLKSLGIDNIARFGFLTPPPSKNVARALGLLLALGALDEEGRLTKPLGNRMAELAVDPLMAKTLLSAPKFGCLSEMLTIASMTTLGVSIWFDGEGEKKAMENARRKFAAEEGDHLTLLNVYQAFVTKGRKEAKFCKENHLNFKSMTRAVSIRNQLTRYLERLGINVDGTLSSNTSLTPLTAGGQSKAEKILRCLTTGYFSHVARMQSDGTFRTTTGVVLHAHPSSLMFNRKANWVLFHEVMETGNKITIRDVSKIEWQWCVEYAPSYYKVTSSGPTN